jgi:hypothetical protein
MRTITRNVSDEMLATLKARFLKDAEERDKSGAYGFANVSRNLVKAIDEEMLCRENEKSAPSGRGE